MQILGYQTQAIRAIENTLADAQEGEVKGVPVVHSCIMHLEGDPMAGEEIRMRFNSARVLYLQDREHTGHEDYLKGIVVLNHSGGYLWDVTEVNLENDD